MILPFLFIAPAGKMGRGVFSAEDIPADTVIEVAPVIVMSAADRLLLDKTLLHDYIFEWGPMQEQCCMALGYVPVYNHSYHSNCEYEMDFDEQTISVKTMRDIRAGEELFINYNGDWDNKKPVWFETV
ncbi:MAG: SET domain-containing protein-lysine N-methyltransferase [Bacteroidetes bacterium]|nr:SET domain-containing protein-lysine N-methyltransferase [Bacteroidota bacterium]